MLGERREQLRGPDLVADPAAHTGGVVEHDAGRHAADVAEHGHEPLAHALGCLAGEDLREADVGEREVADQVVHALLDAHDPEVGLAEVDLHLAGAPFEVQVLVALVLVGLLVRLDVALHGAVRPVEPALAHEALVDPLGGVPLLVPVPAVLLQPRVDRRLVGVELRRPRFLDGDLRREVVLPDVLAHGRLRDPCFSRDLGDG